MYPSVVKRKALGVHAPGPWMRTLCGTKVYAVGPVSCVLQWLSVRHSSRRGSLRPSALGLVQPGMPDKRPVPHLQEKPGVLHIATLTPSFPVKKRMVAV